MTENEVANALLRRRIVPVVVIEERETARPLAEALEQGGLPIAEVTFRTEVAADAMRLLAHDTRLLVGAGTVVRPDQVDVAVEAGARFIVMPGLSPRVVQRCRDLNVLVIPGVATATEVIAALDHGLDLLKLFPAQAAGGVALLRALHGPFPGVRWIPTGGVSAANAASYLALPAVAAVGAAGWWRPS